MRSILESLPCPQSPWLAWMGIPLQLLQAIFLHPYFQLNYPKSTGIYRAAVIPICIYLGFATVVRRSFLPLDQYINLNFGFTTLPTFHFICLSIIFGLYKGPVFKSEVEWFKLNPEPLDDQATTRTNDSKIKLENKTSQPKEGTDTNKNSINNNYDNNFNIDNNLRDGKSNWNPRGSNSVNHDRMNRDQEEKDKTKCPAHDRCTPSKELGKPPSIGELTRWISALIMSPRGIICTWSPPESVVPIRKYTSYGSFLLKLILRTIVMHFWFQCVCGLGVEIVKNCKGDANQFLFQTIGLPQLQVVQFFTPYLLTVLLGGGAYSGFALIGGIFNLIEITIIEILRKVLPDGNEFKPEPVNPLNYPPLFNSPWTRTSLTEFWGQGWQAVFRFHFLFCGAQPMWFIFSKFNPTIGKLAAVMGAMGLSAAMHEFCLVSISRFDPKFSSSRMFLSQGIGIVLEAITRKVTGRKVSGLLGWIWTFSFVILNAKPMVDAWVQRDVARGLVPFQEWSLMHVMVPFGPMITKQVYDYLSSWFKFF